MKESKFAIIAIARGITFVMVAVGGNSYKFKKYTDSLRESILELSEDAADKIREHVKYLRARYHNSNTPIIIKEI